MSRFRSTSVTVNDEPQRWDREKFERYGGRGHERDDIRFEERERFGPRGGITRDVVVEDRFDRRGPRGRYDEDIRFYEEDRYRPGRRRMEFIDDPITAESAGLAVAPYRRREYAEAPVRRPARPGFIRRQSSLDTFDRRPLPRYGDEYRLPADVPIPLPIRRPRSPPRRYRDEYEEVSYKDLPSRGREYDEYRDIRIKRERRSRSRAAASVRSASSSSSSFEEITAPEPPKIGKKGKTRMPKRLVHKKAIIDMGLPFEEEEDFFIVQRALSKVHIDEIIEKSKSYREEKVIYKYTAETEKEDIRDDARSTKGGGVEEDEEIITKKTTVIEGLPPAAAGSVRAPSPARTERSHHTHRSSHAPALEEYRSVREEKIEESNHIGGPLTVLAPQNRHRDEQDIHREIRSLEAERRALKLEREADLIRSRGAAGVVESDYELVERVDRWEDRPEGRRERARSKSVVRVEKDRKGRLALVRSTH